MELTIVNGHYFDLMARLIFTAYGHGPHAETTTKASCRSLGCIDTGIMQCVVG